MIKLFLLDLSFHTFSCSPINTFPLLYFFNKIGYNDRSTVSNHINISSAGQPKDIKRATGSRSTSQHVAHPNVMS